jgi:hypothetical protein
MDDSDTKAPSPSAKANASASSSSPASAPVATSGKQIEDIVIKVTPVGNLPLPRPTVDTEIQCTLEQQGNSNGGGLKGQVIELDYGAGPFCIRFKLEGGLDWRAGDPFWVCKGSACPPPNALDATQIWLDKNPKNKIVSILNMNIDPCTLHYRLNFDGNLHFDPEFKNGGGGSV